MREDSETYLKQFINTLDSNVPTSVYIPSGFAHGFMAITDATIIYLQSDTYKPENEKSIHYSFVEWPKPIDGAYIISEKDEKAKKWI
jgi:dTDP-4-dehydrorhamnose 3,5-epimerase